MVARRKGIKDRTERADSGRMVLWVVGVAVLWTALVLVAVAICSAAPRTPYEEWASEIDEAISGSRGSRDIATSVRSADRLSGHRAEQISRL